MGAGHVRFSGCFINENEVFRLQVFLFLLPVVPLLLHVGAILFRGPGDIQAISNLLIDLLVGIHGCQSTFTQIP